MKILTFECSKCGTKQDIEQDEDRINEPESCPCGRKGKFKLIGGLK